MKKAFIKKIGIIITFIILAINTPFIVSAANNNLEVDGFNILPELKEEEIVDVNEKIATIGQTGGNVWKAYNETASGMTTSKQIASGIMNWNTIMDYLVFVVQFLSQLGLTVGAGFIIYAGYTYMLSVFSGKAPKSDVIKNAIIGVVIVIFSYAIMKTLTSLIGLS